MADEGEHAGSTEDGLGLAPRPARTPVMASVDEGKGAQGSDLRPGDRVWARLPPFPWWPALVRPGHGGRIDDPSDRPVADGTIPSPGIARQPNKRTTACFTDV